MTIKKLKYFIILLSFAILISSSLMLLLCNDVDFYDNKSSVCGINISAIIFILYIIIILFILSFILCLIQCYSITNSIENNITNSIENNITNSIENNITNNITNNIEHIKIFNQNNKKYNSLDKLENILNQLP